MKRTLTQPEKVKEQIPYRIDDKKAVYDERPGKWQASEHDYSSQEKASQLLRVLDNLEVVLDNFEMNLNFL